MTIEDCIYNEHYDIASDTYLVRMSRGDLMTLELPVLSNAILNVNDIILKSEYDSREENASSMFVCGRNLKHLRETAVMGVTSGSSAVPGRTPISKYTQELCPMDATVSFDLNEKCISS